MAFRILFLSFPFLSPSQHRRTREVKKQWAYDPSPPSLRSSTESLFAPLSPFFLSCPLLFAVSCLPLPLSSLVPFLSRPPPFPHRILVHAGGARLVSPRLASRASRLVQRHNATRGCIVARPRQTPSRYRPPTDLSTRRRFIRSSNCSAFRIHTSNIHIYISLEKVVLA